LERGVKDIRPTLLLIAVEVPSYRLGVACADEASGGIELTLAA
jgi:hypothetical protein